MLAPDKNALPRTVLLTGFGPFPGVPVNASAELVRVVVQSARPAFPAFRFVAAVLPTEWRRAPELVAMLQDRFRPCLALHLGVASGEPGIRLETGAKNVCRPSPDAAGLLPISTSLCIDGPAERPATLENAEIAALLQARGTRCTISDDAGGYLCNAVLYQSLASAEARGCGVVGFVHIPADLRSASAITMDEAASAVLVVLGAVLGVTDATPAACAYAEV